MTKKIITLFFVFCFIYPVIFRLVPIVSFRTIYGVIGAFVLVVFKRQQFIVNNNILKILYTPLPVFFVAIISNMINGTTETYFMNLMYSFLLVVLAAYVATSMIKSTHGEINFELISSYLIAAAVLQNFLSAMMLIFPDFGVFMLETLTVSEYGTTLTKVKDTRLLGVGGQYVAHGIVNSFTLLMVVNKLKDKHNTKITILLFFIFVFITVIGSMVSRTTLIGTTAGLILLFIYIRFQILKYLKKITLGVILITVLYIVVIPSSMKTTFNKYFEYGFEMLYAYEEEGKLATDSTDELKAMWYIQPNNLKTWIIGDGYFADPLSQHDYYMATDVGYFRLIFYFGILGCITYIYYQYQIIKQANLRTKRKHQIFFIFCFILFIILNVKVLIELVAILMLFLFSEDKIEDKKKGLVHDSKKKQINDQS